MIEKAQLHLLYLFPSNFKRYKLARILQQDLHVGARYEERLEQGRKWMVLDMS